MATALVRTDPPGIVVQDGSEPNAAPRILMWYWANEDEIPEWERE